MTVEPSAANQNDPAPRGKLAVNIVHFARVLREAGLPVGPGQVLDALDAVRAGGIAKREDFYWTLHAVLVKRREHTELFDQAFHVFWKKPKMLEQLMQLMYHAVTRAGDPEDKKKAGFRRLAEAMFDQTPPQSRREEKAESLELDGAMTASARETLRTKDFEQMTVAEQALAKKAMAALHLHRPLDPTRRFRPSPHGRRIDMRGSLRASLRAGGDIIALSRRERRRREPPLVALCDISGSCSNYSRLFLHFLHTLANDRERVHIFLFGTRLTNITRELKRRDVDEAMAKVSGAVKDWSGGTRIGAILREFNYVWARRVLTQGAHVLIVSDGLDRDDADLLSAEMARLARTAKRVVWLNPLLRFERFEALAKGIKAMMPHVDEFRPVHSLESIEDLARTLASPRRPEHDPRNWMERR